MSLYFFLQPIFALPTPEFPGLAPGMVWIELLRMAGLCLGIGAGCGLIMTPWWNK